ncbi:Protein phosphatase PP2A regulatory subunit B [Orbilia blumenaviensis]|uniref:aminodeoxychorismate synthase n=1 Tax=Orbilia blumenaviensis TaxID=1796055 RepID=A0AAV9V3R7_9PEZI
MTPVRRILLVDAYDSFSNNLAALIRLVTHADVHTIKINTYNEREFRRILKSFDAIVIGPGPGTPTDIDDVGIIPHIYNLPEEEVIPVFGVCLGFQSLCLEFGATISRLKVVKHGQSSIIKHHGNDLFQNCGEVDAIRYHSLRAEMNEEALKELQVLAVSDDGPEENGEVIMAVKHKRLPYWGVQYHPESCCTNLDGAKVVANWWRLATGWLNRKERVSQPLPEGWVVPLEKQNLLGMPRVPAERTIYYQSFHAPCLDIVELCELLEVRTQQQFVMLDSSAKHTGRYTIIGVFMPKWTDTYTWRVGDENMFTETFGKPGVDQEYICPDDSPDGIWGDLASRMASMSATGGDEECPFWGGFIGYFNYEAGVSALDVELASPRGDEREGRTKTPDMNLTFFGRSIVVDNISGKVWVQTLEFRDETWVLEMTEKIKLLAAMSITPTTTPPNEVAENGVVTLPRSTASSSARVTAATAVAEPLFPISAVKVTQPDKEKYIANVENCQRELAKGESYELCLTAQTTVDLEIPFTDDEDSAWKIYKHLRKRNPAPFAGFYRAGNTTLVSSSPERFLSWDRHGHFQLRPIKGTVRKAKPDGTIVTRREAEEILNTPKERAENLMIVDLIRHDLHGVLDGQEDEDGGVKVSKLMGIEEYETVFQLVSVIEGRMGEHMREEGFSGMDVLYRSLPPGSMTGAPKKRSVEILQDIERDANEGNNRGERGVYSGVFGYWSVCGAGDWSVVIRSMYRFNEEFHHENIARRETGMDTRRERWRLGAGGAVTALSDPEGEWEEMLTKLNSTLAVFQ